MARIERTYSDPDYKYNPNPKLSLSYLIESMLGGPPDMTGWRVVDENVVPQQSFLAQPKGKSAPSSDEGFEPVAPLKDYVPEWKRKEMAKQKTYNDFASRLNTQPLSGGLTNYK